MYKLNAAWAVLALVGCASTETGLDTQTIAQDIPLRWEQGTALSSDVINQNWWQSFGSAELSTLVEQTQVQSLDVAAAIARVHQADARARQARAGLLPDVKANLGATKLGALDNRLESDTRNWSVALSASYELDFWGRQRSLSGAAQSSRLSSVFDHDTVKLTVTAAVAQAWFQCVGLRERVSIAKRNLEVAGRLLKLVESKARLGAATSVELAQQRGLVAAQQRGLALLEKQEADARSLLALLSGRWSIEPVSEASLLNLAVPDIHQGEPVDLITRRPDVAKVEAQLSAADANLAVARAAMLPRMTLTAGLGFEHETLNKVLTTPLYSLAMGLAAPVFDAGRLAASRDLAAAQREELLVSYRQSIVQAFNDVQIALNAVDGAEKQAFAQTEELVQAQKALALAESRYRAGAETLLTLLDVQRAAYLAQDMAVQVRQERLQASIALYKALGGGWRRASGEGEG